MNIPSIRSAATVIAFAMKNYELSLSEVLSLTKKKRPIINPNQGFMHQLVVYEGILEASRQRNSFRNRSMSDGHVTNSRKCKSDSEKHLYFLQAKENLLKNLDLRRRCFKNSAETRDGEQVCLDIIARRDESEEYRDTNDSVKNITNSIESKLNDNYSKMIF